MKNNFKTVAFVLALSFGLLSQSSCYKDNKEAMYPNAKVCDSTNVSWANSIQPIVNNSCNLSGCHNSSSSVGGYDLSNYEGVKRMVTNNRFLQVVTSGSMPKGASKLDDCSITKIRIWIEGGALEN